MPFYYIMTADGWKPLPITINVPREVMRNPFRCWQSAGAASYMDWLRK